MLRFILLGSLVLSSSLVTATRSTPPPAPPTPTQLRALQVEAWIRDLGHADPRTRDSAAAKLVRQGESIRQRMVQLQSDPRLQVAIGARDVLRQLDEAAAGKGIVIELEIRDRADWPGSPLSRPSPVPLVVPVMRNLGEAPVNLIRAIDGSDVGWRPVRYEWQVNHSSGAPADPLRRVRCGNVSGLSEDDLFTLEPGETFVPLPGRYIDEFKDYYQLPAGEYDITFTYRFDPVHDSRALPLSEDADILPRATPLKVTSAPLRVVVP